MCSQILLWKKKGSFQLKPDYLFGKIGNLLNEGNMYIFFPFFYSRSTAVFRGREDILLTKEAGDIITIITVGWLERKCLINYL